MHLESSENAAMTEQSQPGVNGGENSGAENQSKQVSPLESGKPSSAAASSDHKGTKKGGKYARRRQRGLWAMVEALGGSGDVAAAAARVMATDASPSSFEETDDCWQSLVQECTCKNGACTAHKEFQELSQCMQYKAALEKALEKEGKLKTPQVPAPTPKQRRWGSLDQKQQSCSTFRLDSRSPAMSSRKDFLGFLGRRGGSISSTDYCEWIEIEATADSGACDSVMSPHTCKAINIEPSELVGEIPTANNTAVVIQATSVAASGSTEDPPAGTCTALADGSMPGDADDPEKPYYACPACELTFARWHLCEAHVEAAGTCREALRISHPRCKWPDGLFQWHQADEKTCRMPCHYRYSELD